MDNRRNVAFSITLDEKQLDFLAADNVKFNRVKCFKTLIQLAEQEDMLVTVGKTKRRVMRGQFIISQVKLAKLWGCSRRTVERIIDDFAEVGLLKYEGDNETTLFTMYCISVWFLRSGIAKSQVYNRFPPPMKKTGKQEKKVRCAPVKEEDKGESPSSPTVGSHDSGVATNPSVPIGNDSPGNVGQLSNSVNGSNTSRS